VVRRAAVVFVALTLWGPAAASAQNANPVPTPPRDSGTEVSVGIGMMRDSDHHAFAGFRGTGALNFTESFAIIGEAQWLTAFAERASSGRLIRDNETTLLTGMRFRKFVDSPAVPYLQISAGYASRIDNGLEIRRSLFAFRTSAGLEMSVSEHFAVRAGGGWTYLFVDAPYRREFGGTVGVTVFLGKR
jgi:hypothetical protein